MPQRPAPEILVDAGLVSELISAQHADLADLTITLLDRGWDNTNYRLGQDLLVRLPHRQAAAELIDNEQRWLPELAPRLPIPIPMPVRLGLPAGRYPWNWSITPWFDGDVAARASLDRPATDAARLGSFFAALHQPAPHNAPRNPYRGGALIDRSDSFGTNLEALDSRFDKDLIASIFANATTVEPPTEPCWLHGDLHTRNMIVDDGELSAIIDWGDICAGDRACDLAAAFMLVPGHIEEVASWAGATPDAWERARGWAAHFAVLYLLFGEDDPVMAMIGTSLMTTLIAT